MRWETLQLAISALFATGFDLAIRAKAGDTIGGLASTTRLSQADGADNSSALPAIGRIAHHPGNKLWLLSKPAASAISAIPAMGADIARRAGLADVVPTRASAAPASNSNALVKGK